MPKQAKTIEVIHPTLLDSPLFKPMKNNFRVKPDLLLDNYKYNKNDMGLCSDKRNADLDLVFGSPKN